MVGRIWRTEVDDARAEDYRDFARSRSLPMFRAEPGFAGVLFAARGAQRAVITLWRDRAAAEALAQSPAYRATVAEIEATGLLRGDSAVEVLELEGAFLEAVATS
jgi:quinol monooxygenase YgiN